MYTMIDGYRMSRQINRQMGNLESFFNLNSKILTIMNFAIFQATDVTTAVTSCRTSLITHTVSWFPSTFWILTETTWCVTSCKTRSLRSRASYIIDITTTISKVMTWGITEACLGVTMTTVIITLNTAWLIPSSNTWTYMNWN